MDGCAQALVRAGHQPGEMVGIYARNMPEWTQADDPAGEQELQRREALYRMDDLLTLIYTSGTTGEPKGVMLDFANIAACFEMHDARCLAAIRHGPRPASPPRGCWRCARRSAARSISSWRTPSTPRH